MIAEHNRKSLLIGIPGLILQTAGCLIHDGLVGARIPHGEAVDILLTFALLSGTVLLLAGLCYYAKAKGYPTAVGLLGLLSCFGVLVLALLPDREKRARQLAREAEARGALEEAVRREEGGDAAAALAGYAEVSRRFPKTEAAGDAEAGARALKSRIGSSPDPG